MMRFFLSAAAALCLILGGCSSDEQKSETQKTDAQKTEAQSGTPAKTSEGEKYPNLATVPDSPPPSTPKVERDKLVQGLLADRTHAEYTEEKLGQDTADLPAAEPPPPGPPPESASKPAESASGEQTEAAEKPPAPPAPTEVAALPTDLGQPAALIYFAGDTSALTDRDRAILSDVASKYKGERSSRVRVIGHASTSEKAAGTGSGAPADLALARADAVAKTLIGMGVPANALETSTGGATYDESQPTGVAANRRVAIYIGS
jgi:outer membrane protein OmpA-like peptidoglycan-associated protein